MVIVYHDGKENLLVKLILKVSLFLHVPEKFIILIIV